LIVGNNGKSYEVAEFDPSSTAGKKWLKKMANKQVTTGTKCHHISNNVPRNVCDFDAAKLKVGVEVAKKWLDRAVVVYGVFSDRNPLGIYEQLSYMYASLSPGAATRDLLFRRRLCRSKKVTVRSVRLGADLNGRVERAAREHGFANPSAFIREAIQRAISGQETAAEAADRGQY
jgi:hypothetical protein